jgi:hypothetical protein
MQHFRRTALGVLVQCFQQISGCKCVSTSTPGPCDMLTLVSSRTI